jgi:hypothetical protein
MFRVITSLLLLFLATANDKCANLFDERGTAVVFWPHSLLASAKDERHWVEVSLEVYKLVAERWRYVTVGFLIFCALGYIDDASFVAFDRSFPTPTMGGVASTISNGASCDSCGASATYAETISDGGSYSKRTIVSTGCPNHYSVCTGKEGVGVCGGIGEEGSGTEATDQEVTVEIPAEPVIATSQTNVECTMSNIAIALNGVGFFSGAVNNDCEKVDVGDDTSEWTTFDMCSGHTERTGTYHYHFPPSCLVQQAEESNPATGDVTGHSPQIGWSYDGFPICTCVGGFLCDYCRS